MTDQHEPAVLAAQRWYGIHQHEHLSADWQQMVDRCALHLSAAFGLSSRQAGDVALQVHGELRPNGSGWRIDTERTTPQVMALVNDKSCATALLTIDEILGSGGNAGRFYGVDMAAPTTPTS